MNKNVLNGLMLAGLLAAGVAVAGWILTSAPKPARVKPEVKARLVDVQPLQASSQRPLLKVGGEVLASQSLSLQSRISGRVLQLNPEALPGAFLAAGTELVRLDADDYRILLAQKQALLEQARADLLIEKGQGALAADEYRMSGANLSSADKALVLRQPQRQKSEAAVASAEAAVRQAKLDLQRISVRMPFNGQIVSRSVAPGAQVSTATALFELINTDQFWIEVKVPRDFLHVLDMTAEVSISHPSWAGQTRMGRILKRLPDVASADRMARLLVAVDDPLGHRSGGPVLLVNDYVGVTLAGKAIDGAIAVPLEQLDNHNRIWVVNQQTLQQRQLTIAWRGREQAWATDGFASADQLLLSRVDAATPGMPVRVNNAAATDTTADPAADKSSRALNSKNQPVAESQP
jgi:RND family efflux transporter MFP subunit